MKLTLVASAVGGGLRELAGGDHVADTGHCCDRGFTQMVREIDAFTTARLGVPNVPVSYLIAGHLFKAQSLSADLDVGRVPMPDSCLVLDGYQRAVIVEFDDIGDACESVGFGVDLYGSQDSLTAFSPTWRSVDSAMRPRTGDRVLVVSPDPIDVD